MNYAIVYLVAILVFSMIYWYVHGRSHYTGPPLATIPIMPDESEAQYTR
jgi:hypothetical protein